MTTTKLVTTIIMAAALLQGCAAPQVNKPVDVLFKEGEQFYRKGNYEDAIAQWKKVKESYQTPELTTRAELGIADAYFLNKDFIESAVAYEDFRKLHPKHPQAAFALYRQAMSYYNQISGIDTDQTPLKNALQIFDSYLKLYPGGEQSAEVMGKISDCRDKQLQYEIYVGRFYLKSDANKAAIKRFEDALTSFPEQPRRDEALYYLGRAYLENGEKAKSRETFERLSREFPASTFRSGTKKSMFSFL
ncbi:MAG: outer membrane protein assembly factor BamD [Desulfuromonadales bacterium]